VIERASERDFKASEFKAEWAPDEVKGRHRQLIDVFDQKSRVAFELKVSANNPHHEFYKDIFKVLVFNDVLQRMNVKPIRKLVFLAPTEGARKLDNEFANNAIALAKGSGLKVKVVAIGSSSSS
jgi:hypothetical protein